MKKITLILLSLLLAAGSYAQSVGINSDGTAPDGSAMLDVKSSSKGFLPPRIALTGSTDASTIESPVAGLLVYNTSNTNDVTPGYYYYSGSAWIKIDAGLWSFDLEEDIYTNYNVGIGTTSPKNKFVVAGNGWSQFITNTNAHNPSADDNYGVYIGSNRSGGATEGNIAYHNYLTFAEWNGTTYSETMRIDASGNVGIGITSPQTMLHVAKSYAGYYDALTLNNTNNLNSGQGVRLRFKNSDYSTGNEIAKSGYIEYGSESNWGEQGYLAFGTNNGLGVAAAERLRITSSGNVGIGTTTPAYPLHVASSASTGSDPGRYFDATTPLTTATQAWALGIYSYYSILTNGAFVAFSDLRIKENVKEVQNSLDLVGKLRPVSYNKIDEIENGGRTEFGFIAQEVEKILPEAVNTGTGEIPVLKPFDTVEFEAGVSYTILVKNGDNIVEQKYTTKDPRPEGEIIVKSKTVDDFKSLSYDMIFTVAVDAIREQQTQIEAQQVQIEALKAQSAVLTQKAESFDQLKAEVENLKKLVHSNLSQLTINQ